MRTAYEHAMCACERCSQFSLSCRLEFCNMVDEFKELWQPPEAAQPPPLPQLTVGDRIRMSRMDRCEPVFEYLGHGAGAEDAAGINIPHQRRDDELQGRPQSAAGLLSKQRRTERYRFAAYDPVRHHCNQFSCFVFALRSDLEPFVSGSVLLRCNELYAHPHRRGTMARRWPCRGRSSLILRSSTVQR
eukprot:SAG11_NODE_469_length_9207_cov_5.391744_6_plen_188_part_00